MIHGRLISLSLVRQHQLNELYELLENVANRGAFLPLALEPEPRFRAHFNQTGFWSDDFGRMLIIHHEQIVGSICYSRPTPYSDALELHAIVFDEPQRGKSFMTEAGRLFIGYLFATRKVHRIEARILPDNAASIRLVQKVGFTLEGTLRGASYESGTYKDVLMFSLLRTETDLAKYFKPEAQPPRHDPRPVVPFDAVIAREYGEGVAD
jgi:[ribosomal protein S5]-alanine N-acetyltransferase